MSYNLIVKEEAHLEAWEAYIFYENRRLGLGETFRVALERRYDDLVKQPSAMDFADMQPLEFSEM